MTEGGYSREEILKGERIMLQVSFSLPAFASRALLIDVLLS
jgi:hypothetical protein